MLLIDFNQLSLKQQMLSSDALIEELQHVHSGALRPKQQQQDLSRYPNHISIDVMIGELPRVHSDTLHFKQQVLLIYYWYQSLWLYLKV